MPIKSVVTRTYKFRLYPDHNQYKKLHKTLGACRWVYNQMVEKIHKEGFQSRNDLNYFLTELKESEPWLYSCHSKMLQMVSTQIDGSQKSLKELRKNGHNTGNLKFARFSEYHTFTYNQSGFEIRNGFLHLSKIGKIKIIRHRTIPENHSIKQVTISKSKTGKWHACVTCEIDAVLPKISLAKSIGIDVGIKNFAYDSDGYQTPNPLNLQKMLKPLARIQRKISRRQKGSKNRAKAVRWYRIIHERIRNRRRDFLHKLSTQYAKKYDVVFLEKLQKLNMVQNHSLARNIMDSGWGTFGMMLDYKTILVEVPARNTTIQCSRCGKMVPKSLAVRTHRCDACGLVLDRDHNSTINILKKGWNIFNLPHQAAISVQSPSTVPQELRELTPVEISTRSRKQEEATGLVR
ncbi:MAG: transposase [Thaumarchaeota archaeon]|nr:transposase [Nitrososphaerota archaeon]